MTSFQTPNSFQTLAVTGGTGFIGRHFLRLAAERGYRLRALTRRPQPAMAGVEWIAGALDDPASLRRLMDDADAVIHIAGVISAPDREGFNAGNAVGTLAVIEAARATGIRRLIHISSLAAREPDLSDYGWSKARSEAIVAASGLDWTAIRPPAVYGEGDRETLELFRMANKRVMLLPPGGRLSLIEVGDLSRLLLAALDDPESIARVYEPDDGMPNGWDHKQLARAIGDALGRKVWPFAVPAWLLRLASRLEARWRGPAAKLTADRVRYFCHPDWVAARDRLPPPLLWRPKTGSFGGLKATAEWYRAEGWL